jgi:hypothetical protein
MLYTKNPKEIFFFSVKHQSKILLKKVKEKNFFEVFRVKHESKILLKKVKSKRKNFLWDF